MGYHMIRLDMYAHFVQIVITDIRGQIICKGMSLINFIYAHHSRTSDALLDLTQ